MKLRAATFAGLAILAVVPYMGILDHQFVFDDKVVIEQNPIVKNFDWGEIIGEPYWFNSSAPGMYRPLTTLSFAVDWALGGGGPRQFLVHNIILHAIATLLVFALMRRLFPRHEAAGWTTAALFAVHPLHVEVVAGIVGRTDLLCAVFVLLSYLAWLDAEGRTGLPRRLLPPLLWLAALLAKENAIVLPLILLLHRRGWIPGAPRGRLRKSDLAWVAAILIASLLRFRALGGIHPPVIDAVANPLIRVDPFQRALCAGAILARQLLQTVTGHGLSADYSYAAIRPDTQMLVLGGLMIASVSALTVVLFRRARQSVEAWGAAFFLIFWFVTSNLILPIGTAQADRLFYLPLLGLFAVAASLSHRLAPPLARLAPRGWHRRLAWGFLALLLAAGTVRSMERARDWKSERTLFESAVRVEPMSIYARWNLSVALLEDEESISAARVLEILEPVASWDSDHAGRLLRHAATFMFLGRNAQADSLLRAALRAGTPDSVDAHIELGNLALQRQDGETALAEFDAAGKTNELPEHVAIGRASALSIMGRYRESAEEWAPVLARYPDSTSVRVAYGYNLRAAGDPRGAIAVLEEGLRLGRNPRVIDELAEAYLAAGRIDDARALRSSITDPDLARRIDQGSGPAAR